MRTTVFEKGKDALKKGKLALAVASGALAATACGALPVMAADGAGGVADTLVSSFTSVGTDMTSAIGKVVPIVVPVIGGVIVVTFIIKLVKKLTGKAG